MSNVTNIRKIRVVQADPANHFALDANGQPDPSVFDDAVWVEASTASVSFSSTANKFDNDRTSGSWGMAAPIPEAVYDVNGNIYKTYTGTMSLTMRARTLGEPEVGDDFESYDELPLIMMLKSGALKSSTDIADPADWGEELGAFGTDNNAGTYNSGDGLTGGDLFQAVVGNDAVVHNILWIDSDDTSVHFTPSWFGVAAGNAIPNNSDVRTMYTLSPDLSGGVPVHIEMFADTFAIRAYGCSASSAVIQGVGVQAVDAAFTFEIGQFEFDTSTTAVKNNTLLSQRVPRPCGKVAQRKGSKMVVSAPLPADCRPNDLADYKLESAGHLCLQAFTFTITNTVERIQCSDNLLGLQSMRIVNQEVEAAITIESSNSSGNQENFLLDDDLHNETYRNYSFAFGPHGPGQGMAVFIPAGYVKESPEILGIGGTTVNREVVIGVGEWYGDNVAEDGTIAAGGESANARFKIGFTR